MAGNKSILILKGQTRYNVLQRVADEMAAAFEKRGYSVTVFDTTAPDFSLADIVNKSYSFCFIPQAFLYDVRLKSGITIPAITSYPWIGWIFDDVLYHLSRVVSNNLPNTFLFSVDRAADNIVTDMELNCNPVGTLLHAGFESHLNNPKKDIDVLIPCTFVQPPFMNMAPVPVGNPVASGTTAINFDVITEELTYKLARESVELWRKSPELSPRAALRLILAGYGKELKGELLVKLSETVLLITNSIRYYCRKAILEAIAESGLNVHLVGEMAADEHYPDNVTVHGPVIIDDTIDLIARAKVLINPFPPIYEGGAHERIFTAMLNKTLCYTPGYPFLKNLLGDKVRYIDLNHISLAVDDIRNFLDNSDAFDEELQEIADYTRTYHTWEHRAEEIIDLIEG